MKVASLWRYPVKTMQGEPIDHADVATDGIPGDRWWALRDEGRGAITGGRRFGRLMAASARFREPTPPEAGVDPGHVDITLPDGGVVGSDSDDIDKVLSDFLEAPVSLWPRLPASEKAHYRRQRQTPWAAVADLIRLMGVERGQTLPRFQRLPPTLLLHETLPGTYFDAAPLLLLTSTTLDLLSQRLPDSQVDVRRFRPNIVLDEADQGRSDHPEQSWIGRRLRIGQCVVKVTSTCPRCVMTTRAFDDLPEDRSILRTVATEMGRNIGVYASVVQPGRVGVGDPAALV